MVTRAMMRLTASIIFALMLPSASFAQGALSGGTLSDVDVVNLIDSMGSPLPTAGQRKIAGIASWATSITAMALDAKATIGGCNGQDECYHAIVTTGLRVGATYGAVFALKKLVHRDRPCAPSCGRDNPAFSMPSGHTAIAFSTLGGPRLAFMLPLSVGTGGLRVAAGKHWITDSLAGAGIGLLTSRIR